MPLFSSSQFLTRDSKNRVSVIYYSIENSLKTRAKLVYKVLDNVLYIAYNVGTSKRCMNHLEKATNTMSNTYTIKTADGYKIIRATDARTAVLKFFGKSPKSACYDVTSSSDGFVTAAAFTATVTKTSKYGTVIIGTVAVYEGKYWAITEATEAAAAAEVIAYASAAHASAAAATAYVHTLDAEVAEATEVTIEEYTADLMTTYTDTQLMSTVAEYSLSPVRAYRVLAYAATQELEGR